MSVLKLVSICLLIVFYLLTICPVIFFFRTSNCPLNWQQYNGYVCQYVISEASDVIIFYIASSRIIFIFHHITSHHIRKHNGYFCLSLQVPGTVCGIVQFCMVCHITIFTLLYMYYYEFLWGILDVLINLNILKLLFL